MACLGGGLRSPNASSCYFYRIPLSAEMMLTNDTYMVCSSTQVVGHQPESAGGEGRPVADDNVSQLDVKPGVATVLVEGRRRGGGGRGRGRHAAGRVRRLVDGQRAGDDARRRGRWRDLRLSRY